MKYSVILKNISKEKKTRKSSQKKLSLEKINMRVKKGEIIGILGKTNSGKNEIFDIISGKTQPDWGKVKVYGSLVFIKSLRLGFQKDESGFKNIHNLCAMYGLKKEEINKVIREIVMFADIEKFIDKPFNSFSDEMQLKLGIAIILHLNFDILLIKINFLFHDDNFRNKCLLKIKELSMNGKTIIYSTQSFQDIEKVCTQVILLNEGRILEKGSPEVLIEKYRALLNKEIPRQKKKYFLALITRCRDEPFLNEFVNYYFHEGVDKIFIIDDNLERDMPETLLKDERIEIIKSRLWKDINVSEMADVNKEYKKLRDNYEWIISVDCDEFITTRKNPEKTIRDELETTFSSVDCVIVPWVMMACGGREKDPESLLQEVIHRWDHDKMHPNPHNWRKGGCRYEEIEVKYIARTSKFFRLLPHFPLSEDLDLVNVVNGPDGKKTKINGLYRELRNQDIENATLICHHYRIASIESCMRKINLFSKLMKDNGFCDGGYPTKEIIMGSDYPEILDETLKKKMTKIMYNVS